MKRKTAITNYAALEFRQVIYMHATALARWAHNSVGDVDEHEREDLLGVAARVFELIENLPLREKDAAGKKAN